MRRQLGETRSVIRANHALVCPDSHENTPVPNWPGSEAVFVVTPDMGAKFAQFFVRMTENASGKSPAAGIERFFLVLDGKVSLRTTEESYSLTREGYALVPADMEHEVRATVPSRLVVLEREFIPLEGLNRPGLVVGHVNTQPTRQMTDDGLLSVRKLLPMNVSFDCEVNVMEFKPGGSLPYVETHFVEHGLLMLSGGGIYRSGDDWYPVEQGDAIWMGPFCEQWFGAIGKSDARYLIYKNWNREPLIG